MIRIHGLTDIKHRATPVEEDTADSKTTNSSCTVDPKPDYAQTLLAKLLNAEARITELNAACISRDSDILRLERQLQAQARGDVSAREIKLEMGNQASQTEAYRYSEEYVASLEQQVLALNHTIDLLKFETFELQTKIDEQEKCISCWIKKSSDLEDVIISQQNEIRQLKMSNAYHEEHYSSLKTSYEVMACINQRALESTSPLTQQPEQNPETQPKPQFEMQSPRCRSNSKTKTLTRSLNLSGTLKNIPKMAASCVLKKQHTNRSEVTPKSDRDRPPTINKCVTPRYGKNPSYTPSFMRMRRPSPFQETMK